jgi:hypothetical protein
MRGDKHGGSGAGKIVGIDTFWNIPRCCIQTNIFGVVIKSRPNGIWMTKEEFRQWRQGFGLTQDETAEMFGVTRNTVQNWENGPSALPASIDSLCEIWSDRLRKEIADLGPVTLNYADGPMFVSPYGPRTRMAQLRQEPYATNAAAIARVRKLWHEPGFHGPFIVEKDDKPLWNQVELMRVVVGDDTRAPTVRNTINKLAKYVLNNSDAFAQDGRRMFTKPEADKHKKRIESVARRLEQLAVEAENRFVAHEEFHELLSQLHELGFYPTERLVRSVAQAIVGEEVAAAV